MNLLRRCRQVYRWAMYAVVFAFSFFPGPILSKLKPICLRPVDYYFLKVDGRGVFPFPKVKYAQHEREEAVSKLKELADQGVYQAQALMYLGKIHTEGYAVVRQDLQLAFAYYERAAHMEFAHAQELVGGLYEQAAEWYEKAARQGRHTAMRLLGILYETGQGVPQSYEKAAEWYEKAIRRGNVALQGYRPPRQSGDTHVALARLLSLGLGGDITPLHDNSARARRTWPGTTRPRSRSPFLAL